METYLQNKTIMVAASSKGLGFGIAQALAQEGARVSMASRNKENIEDAAASLHKCYGAEVKGYTFDAADADSIQRWTAQTRNDFGRIDGLVVNAGGPPPGKFDAFDDTSWSNAFQLTLMSAVRMIRAVLPSMRAQGAGSIVTVTSTSIKEPIDVLLLSNVFRSGVVSLVKSLSKDLAAEGIRINNLVPGRMDTDRVRAIDAVVAEKRGLRVEQVVDEESAAIPFGRYGKAEEFGRAATFLLSDAASYITGATLLVDGGKTSTVW